MNVRTTSRALDLIESAIRSQPYCPCGEPTDAVARDGEIWLDCVTLREDKGVLQRLMTLDFATHLSRPVVADPAALMAA